MRTSVRFIVVMLLGAGISACALYVNKVTNAAADQKAAESRDEPSAVAPAEYFWDRLSYPTGTVDQRWQLRAALESAELASARPKGANRDLSSALWTPLGPAPLDHGNSFFGASGLVGGRINVIRTHPNNPAIAWAGSDGGGIWKTTNCCDANTTWIIKTDLPSVASSAIGDLTLDPNNADVLYAGTGDLRFTSFSFGAAGILKSSDAGESWQTLGLSTFNGFYPPSAGGFPQYQAIGKILVDPANSNTIVVGSKTGLFLSFDAGANWTGPCLSNAFPNQRQDVTGLLLLARASAPSRIIAAVGVGRASNPVQPNLSNNGANGVYGADVPMSACPSNWQTLSRSDNGWEAGIADGVPDTIFGRIELAAAASQAGTIYAQVGNIGSQLWHGFYRSLDFGISWEKRSADLPSDCFNANVQSWYNAGLSVAPNDPTLLYASGVDVFRSSNGAQSFSNISCGYGGLTPVHVDNHGRAFAGNDPNKLLVSTDGGVFYSANPAASAPSFIALNRSFNTIEFYGGDLSANFATAAEKIMIAGAQDNGSSVVRWNGAVGPSTWRSVLDGDGAAALIEPVLQQRVYASQPQGNFFASSAGIDASFAANVSPNWPSGERLSFLTPLTMYRYGDAASCGLSLGCTHLLSASQRVWESIQGGIPASSWYPNSPDLTKGSLGARSFVNQLAHSFTDPSLVIAGSNDGNVWFGFGLGQGTPNSAHWVNVSGGNSVLPNRPILDVSFDAFDTQTGYVAVGGFTQNTPTTSGQVFRVRCANACASFTWTDLSGNLPNAPVNAISANPRQANQLFVGTDFGVFYTDNVNAVPVHWARLAEFPNVMVWDFTIDRGFTTLAAFTRSRGAWVVRLPGFEELLFRSGFE
jgi:hypothetical protein